MVALVDIDTNGKWSGRRVVDDYWQIPGQTKKSKARFKVRLLDGREVIVKDVTLVKEIEKKS